jgi:hypothetical protein
MDAFQIALSAGTSHPDWLTGWVGAILGALIGTTIGGGVPLWWASRLRRLERKGQLFGMMAELRLAQLYMSALLSDGYASPLYRLPLSMFEQALPKLIGDGKLTINEIGVLVEYVNRIEELNRGLDRSAEASTKPANGGVLAEEHSRNKIKANNILNEKLARRRDLSVYNGAWYALFRVKESDEHWWLRLWGAIVERIKRRRSPTTPAASA